MAKIKYNATESRWELLDNSNVVVDYAIGSEDAYPWELTWNTIQVEQVGSVDATATAGQILEGETAIVRGVKVTGTMANNGEFVFTPDASGVMKDGGYYKSIYVAGDSDLVSGNIKEGVSIFGVTGTLKEGESVDWSKVTAESSDILEGHTILKDGAMVSGTMTNFEDVSIELTSSVQTLESGYYNSITIPAKPDEGATLPTGITVQPTDVLDGKFYIDADGNKQEGTMPNKGLLQATLEYDSQIIEGGYYSEIIIPGSLTAGVDFDLVDAEAVNVLEGYKFVDGLGNITEGSMPNNGILEITPSESVQEYSGGYYGGITVEAVEPDSGNVVLPEGITVTPADVKDGIFYIDSEGAKQEGTMPVRGSKTVTLSTSVQTLPAGYYESVTVPGSIFADLTASQIELATSDASNVLESVSFITGLGTVKQGAMPNNGILDVTLTDSVQEFAAGYYGGITVPAKPSDSGTGSSDVEYGYIDDSGNFQPLDLSGDTPVATGTAESMASLDMFKTGVNEPSYPSGGGSSDGGGGLEFYECASYTPNADAYTRTIMTLSGAADENANGTYVRTKWVEPPPEEVTNTPTAVWQNENGYRIEEVYYTEFNYNFLNASGDIFCTSNAPYFTRVTDYSSIAWWNIDIGGGVHYNFSAWQTEEGPATTEGWTGYKMTWTAIGSTDTAQPVETIVVSDYSLDSIFSDINGSYRLEDEGSLGASRRFICAENGCHISFDDAELNPFSSWILFDTSDDIMVYAMANGDESIEEICSLEWDSLQIPDSEMGTITYVVEAQGGDSTSAFGWVKSDTLTEGLTVKGYTPVVGKIYDQDATILVTSMYAD